MSYTHYILKVDSRDSTNYGVTTNPMQIHLPNNNRTIVRIVLKNASIPNVFYNINTYNNVLKIDATTYTFPIGRYNVDDIITYFNSQVLNIVLSFNSFLNKFTFTSTINATFDASGSTMFYVLGLNEKVNYNVVIGVQSALYMGDLSGPRNIHIECSFANMNTLDSTGKYKSYIANIPVDVGYLSVIHYTNQTIELDQVVRSAIYSQNLSLIDITLKNNRGEILDMQNQHYELSFKITTLNNDTLYE